VSFSRASLNLSLRVSNFIFEGGFGLDDRCFNFLLGETGPCVPREMPEMAACLKVV
jgi:hypothetical protein